MAFIAFCVLATFVSVSVINIKRRFEAASMSKGL